MKNNARTYSRSLFILLIAILAIGITAPSCGVGTKLKKIQRDTTLVAELSLGIDTSNIPLIENKAIARDTIKFKDLEGNEMIVMKAIRDDDGDMVANETLDAAVVTARFRNVAERAGKVLLSFQVKVPHTLQDNKWQLRFFPDMFVMGDSVRLEPVVITGKTYKKSALRGYQQYEKLLLSIIQDSTRFIDLKALEIFMERYLPDVYALKTDTTIVSDEQMSYMFGITQKQAVEHYTNKLARSVNNNKIRRKNELYDKYVKAYGDQDIRLDTVMVDPNGDFIYNYIQELDSRPGLRKADIVLSGDIYEGGNKIFTIPSSEPLTFYISSLSIFTQDHVRYVQKVIERRAEANMSGFIEFASGKSDIDFSLADNANEVEKIKGILRGLAEDTVFDLDSIMVSSSASPEGAFAMNQTLSGKRSASISAYFQSYLREYQDSLDAEKGFSVDIDGNTVVDTKRQAIRFISASGGENWKGLDELVEKDTVLTDAQKKDYASLDKIKDPDARENKLRAKASYSYIRSELYPKLRSVKFEFYMHRKGMVKDTVHTTEIDTMYRNGLQALKDMDYDRAISLLAPYHDFNTAVAYMAQNRNYNAMTILEKLQRTAEVNYLMAILHSRMNDPQKAVECYMQSCKQNSSYIYRGNLDPEISELIRIYGLNKEEDDEFDF